MPHRHLVAPRPSVAVAMHVRSHATKMIHSRHLHATKPAAPTAYSHRDDDARAYVRCPLRVGPPHHPPTHAHRLRSTHHENLRQPLSREAIFATVVRHRLAGSLRSRVG